MLIRDAVPFLFPLKISDFIFCIISAFETGYSVQLMDLKKKKINYINQELKLLDAILCFQFFLLFAALLQKIHSLYNTNN